MVVILPITEEGGAAEILIENLEVIDPLLRQNPHLFFENLPAFPLCDAEGLALPDHVADRGAALPFRTARHAGFQLSRLVLRAPRIIVDAALHREGGAGTVDAEEMPRPVQEVAQFPEGFRPADRRPVERRVPGTVLLPAHQQRHHFAVERLGQLLQPGEGVFIREKPVGFRRDGAGPPDWIDHCDRRLLQPLRQGEAPVHRRVAFHHVLPVEITGGLPAGRNGLQKQIEGQFAAAGAEESAAHRLDPQPEAIVGFGGELQRLGGVAGIVRDEADAAFVPPGGEKLHLTEPGIVADAEVVGEFDVLYLAVAFLPFADDHPFAEGIEEFVIEWNCEMRRFDEIGQKVGRNSGERRAEPEGAVLAVADFESEPQPRHGAALRPARLACLEAERGKAGVIKFEVVPVLPQKAERKGPFHGSEQRKIAVFQRENGAVFPGEDQPALSVVPMDLIHKKPLCC